MESLRIYDIYDFVDDGINESIYTILTRYHPYMKKDFSLANMINHITEVEHNEAQERSDKSIYEKYFSELADCLASHTTLYGGIQEKSVPEERKKQIFASLSEICKDIPECKDFITVKAYTEFAKKNMDDPKTKPLRDAIVDNAVEFFPREDAYLIQSVLLKGIYLDRAIKKATPLEHKNRKIGDYPELDRMKAFNQILMKKEGLQEYEEFYYEAQAKIREAALKAMEKARIETVCTTKRKKAVKAEINPSISSDQTVAAATPISAMFDPLKRIPKKGESAWVYESLKEPELLCDLDANYSKDGIENQRVIAIRLGKLKYKDPQILEGLNYDRTAEMPELIGVTRIGKDETKNYFVLMPPIDRLTFRPVGEKPQEPGEKPFEFSITQDIQVQTRSGLTRIERQTNSADIVDAKTGQKMNAFKNKEIPEALKEFFAKVYFSDEYLSAAIENNARYIGHVVETDNGPQIRASDVEKADIAAAHYAAYHPGIVDKLPTKSFTKYCASFELQLKYYNALKKHQREKDASKKKDEDAR